MGVKIELLGDKNQDFFLGLMARLDVFPSVALDIFYVMLRKTLDLLP
jgi:hypothetical protein